MEKPPGHGPVTSDLIRDTIIALCAARGDGKSICPSDVARALDAAGWRAHLSRVRSVAADLARQGRIDILRKGRRIDPDHVKGVIRLRLASDAAGRGLASCG